MTRAGASKRFINTLGTWEIQDDGTVRLISEAAMPRKVKERRKWKKNASKEERN